MMNAFFFSYPFSLAFDGKDANQTYQIGTVTFSRRIDNGFTHISFTRLHDR